MSEHQLERIEDERGVTETRFHAVCSCSWIGPDRPAKVGYEAPAEIECERDHKLHSEGKSPAESADHSKNPGVKGWSERIEREGY